MTEEKYYHMEITDITDEDGVPNYSYTVCDPSGEQAIDYSDLPDVQAKEISDWMNKAYDAGRSLCLLNARKVLSDYTETVRKFQQALCHKEYQLAEKLEVEVIDAFNNCLSAMIVVKPQGQE